MDRMSFLLLPLRATAGAWRAPCGAFHHFASPIFSAATPFPIATCRRATLGTVRTNAQVRPMSGALFFQGIASMDTKTIQNNQPSPFRLSRRRLDLPSTSRDFRATFCDFWSPFCNFWSPFRDFRSPFFDFLRLFSLLSKSKNAQIPNNHRTKRTSQKKPRRPFERRGMFRSELPVNLIHRGSHPWRPWPRGTSPPASP